MSTRGRVVAGSSSLYVMRAPAGGVPPTRDVVARGRPVLRLRGLARRSDPLIRALSTRRLEVVEGGATLLSARARAAIERVRQAAVRVGSRGLGVAPMAA